MTSVSKLTEERRLLLLSVLSLSIILIFGLGWLVASPLLSNKSMILLEDFPLAFLCGLLANYGIILCFQSLGRCLLIGSALSILGYAQFGIHVCCKGCKGPYPLSRPVIWCGILVVLLLYAIKILSEPLAAWDARSIWFFHAKMIYVKGALSQAAGWNHAAAQFSHVDYPKLLSSLAAEVSYPMRYWNEYLPKVALLLLLIPPVFWIYSFLRYSWSSLFLLCIFPFMMGEWLWNGYMDGYLAIYLAVAMLLVGRYITKRQPLDLISSLGCLVFIPNLKNEGLLEMFIGAIAITITGIKMAKANMLQLEQVIRLRWPQSVSLIVCIIPCLVWYLYYRIAWGLTNDLQIGTHETFTRILQRITDWNSIALIFGSILNQLWFPILILSVLFIVLMTGGSRMQTEMIPPIITGTLYALCLFIVYLLTPNDLAWHLTNSVNRTILSAKSCFLVGIFWMMHHLENKAECATVVKT